MSSTAGPASAERLIREVYDFARAATAASGLPGRDSGLADAFRHMVGAAELARRIGALPAYAAVEGNETISWFMERYNAFLQREPGPGRNEEDRAMDRINNAIGIRIGLRASNPTEVLNAARFEIERAYERGPGVGGAATWLPTRSWVESIRPDSNWPPRSWPEIEAAPDVRAYPGHAIPSIHRRAGAMGGGPVQVRPHSRDGHPVQGYSRAAPAR
ncbi:hypothetical protein [Sediminicoccus sp. KRV36]|uniref:hypothetical protein n=1 Tax=Sediminicoccus sp. KRV36 TaxID=3133721 RepID=UPI00200CAB42|nr:hypothetical protein [Sediminicoccus rosea]UPY37945.1 hypothetical protein LHU95_04400 [Sediminicoccus rosea]